MKNKISILLFSIIALSGKAQSSNYYISFGTIRSDINESIAQRESEIYRNTDDNTPKNGIILTVGRIQKLWSRVSLDLSLNYQERLPLEKFTFSTPSIPYTNGVLTLSQVPTSPQSKMWDSEIYKRLTNFKYAHIEVIPMYTLGKKFKISFGLGLFYGYLLNHKSLIFTEDDFPSFEFIFNYPFNAFGVDRYRKSDIGWMPKLRFDFPLSKRMKIGLSSKGYFSQYELKQNPKGLTLWGRKGTSSWEVYSLNIEFFYTLNSNNK